MKNHFRLVWLFFSLITQHIIVAQEADSLDLVIKLPIKIDKIYSEIIIDSAVLKTFYFDEKSFKIDFIEDINKNFLQELVKNSFLNHFFQNSIVDTIAFVVKENKIPYKQEFVIVLFLDENNKLTGIYTAPEENLVKSMFFSDNEQFIPIKIDSNNKTRYYIIINPFFEQEKKKLLGFIKRKEPRKFQFILTVGLHNGISSLKFKPDTSQNIVSVYYNSRLTSSFNIKMTTIYSVKNFLIGTYICYQNNNYTDNTRIIAKKSGASVNFEYLSRGNWPVKLLHLGAVSGYDFLAFEKLIISPCINAGIYFYPNSNDYFDNELSTRTLKQFKKKYSFGGSMNFKLPINDDFMVISGFSYQFNSFDASGYFTDIKKNSYHSRQEIFILEFGVCMKF